jgi:hypothetical protein
MIEQAEICGAVAGVPEQEKSEEGSSRFAREEFLSQRMEELAAFMSDASLALGFERTGREGGGFRADEGFARAARERRKARVERLLFDGRIGSSDREAVLSMAEILGAVGHLVHRPDMGLVSIEESFWRFLEQRRTSFVPARAKVLEVEVSA